MTQSKAIFEALKIFGNDIAAKMNQTTVGQPEDQLRGPFEQLINKASTALGMKIVCTGEVPLRDQLGRPDYAVHKNELLTGYVEIKAPGTGANTSSYKGHNQNQWKRFSSIPNILYTDGNQWAIYRSGERHGDLVTLSGDVSTDGAGAATHHDAVAIEHLIREFLDWQPIIPTGKNGELNLSEFAKLIAPLCRLLRNDVTDALMIKESPLNRLADDWRDLLFPEATNERFADAYAQTVTFALLLGRSDGADPLTLQTAEQQLESQHNLLARALQVLTARELRTEMEASLNLLERVIGAVPPATFADSQDPWLYFYEDFLAEYDSALRKDWGVYYTPVEVVRAQVRLVDDLLVNRLGIPGGFASQEVVTLDPATGTGTYLLGVIEHALQRVKSEQGAGAVAGRATELAKHLFGFENMVGPYAVSELRVSQALKDRGAILPPDGPQIYLTDTLERPDAIPLNVPQYLTPISEQHEKAIEVKRHVPVMVCIGNPPYHRHDAAQMGDGGKVMDSAKGGTGSWVRWGDSDDGSDSILRDFIDSASNAGHGVHIKNIYNFYVYFWRWAIWKVFEHTTSSGPGIVSFITSSSYLGGDGFSGMRQHMREQCDEVWIIDLGGEGRGTRKEENIFAIQTPVAIAVAMRSGNADITTPATVHYTRINGTREAKLSALDSVKDFSGLDWQDCSDNWQAPFKPEGVGEYFTWPLLTDLMPWQRSGIKSGRTWVISPDASTLKKSWRRLVEAPLEDKAVLFKDSPTGRKVNQRATQLPPSTKRLPSIASIGDSAPPPPIVRLAYRSFDRQYLFADARLLDRPGPDMWKAHSDRQIYLSTNLQRVMGIGPALTSAAFIPDLNHFCNRGAKDTIPLYRDAFAIEPNVLPGFLEMMASEYGHEIAPEKFVSYLYGILAQPDFTERFNDELVTRELRVPITKDAGLFDAVAATGAHLLWLHTYGERLVPEGHHRGEVPTGKARNTLAVPGDDAGYPDLFDYSEGTQTLRVGDGEFSPVSRAVYESKYLV